MYWLEKNNSQESAPRKNDICSTNVDKQMKIINLTTVNKNELA